MNPDAARLPIAFAEVDQITQQPIDLHRPRFHLLHAKDESPIRFERPMTRLSSCMNAERFGRFVSES